MAISTDNFQFHTLCDNMHNMNDERRNHSTERIDLNLLTVFDAVWRTRNVGRAAVLLSLSQPATSHALARLRDIVDDALFERTPSGVRPTAKAEAMWPDVSAALASARSALHQSATPVALGRRLVLGMTANVALTLLPGFVSRARETAPDLDISIKQIDRVLAPELLRRGQLDAVVGSWNQELPTGLTRSRLYTEKLVFTASQDHPALGQELTPRQFSELSHVLVSPSGEPYGPVDAVLARMDLKRRIALVVPDYRMAIDVISKTDLVCSLSLGAVTRTPDRFGISYRELPVPVDDLIIDLVAPSSAAPLSKWLHSVLVESD